MTNALNSNPMYVDSAATIWSGVPKSVKLIQWVDVKGAELLHDDELTMTINGTPISLEFHGLNDNIHIVLAWQAGPFTPPLSVDTFVVTTIEGGAVLIFLE